MIDAPRGLVVMAVVGLLEVGLGRASAQPAATPPQTLRPTLPQAPVALPSGDVPLQCWWRPSNGAIRVGEIVEVTLTCSALESDAVRAVPDESRLTVAAVQMAPWEIVGGSHPADTRAGNRRLFQYAYQLRMLDADAIGRDVRLPPLVIPYRVESRMGADATLAGRDLVHQMPQIPIRVVAQVPGEASDIRDGSSASLSEIAALRFRANAFRMTGTALAALAGLAVLGALAPLVGRLRKARPTSPGGASDRAVLAYAATRLDDLAREAAGGWTPELLRDGHTTARLVAGVVVGDGVRQVRLGDGEAVPEGRVLFERRFGRLRSALTASVTPAGIARALAALPASGAAERRGDLERLRDSLDVLSRAQYSQHSPADDRGPIDAAVAAVSSVARSAARARLLSVGGWRRRPATTRPTLEF